MARSIDERIVEMRFDNRQFEQGVTKSLKTLEALKEGLKLDEAAKSLENLEVAGNKFNLQSMADSLDGIANRFSTMGIIGMTVIANLTNAALDFAKRGASAVLTPILEGGRKRALNIEQAKFQFKGLGMDVEATMASANEAVLGTAYGLDEAARVAGQLGATGMRAGEDMTSALRAVAGVAAMTSSSYDDMGHIFTTIAGNGRLMGMQLTQLATKGLNAAAILANEFGTTEAVIREMVSKGQVSFDMFYKAMDNAFGEHATKANELYTGSLANMKAALSRIGAKIQTPHLENMRDIFNSLSPVINNVNKALDPFINFVNKRMRDGSKVIIKLAESFHEFDKVNAIITPLNTAVMILYQALKAVVDPIREAFKEVFNPITHADIVKIAEAIKDFSAKLLISGETGERIKSVFKGLFSILDILKTVVVTVAHGIAMIFGAALPAGGGILTLAAALGDFASSARESIKATGIFETALKTLKIALEPIQLLFTNLKVAGGYVVRFIKWVGSAMFEFFKMIRTSTEGLDFNLIFGVLHGVLMASILKNVDGLVSKFKSFVDISKKFKEIFGKNVSGALEALGGVLESYQNKIRADAIMKIALAVGVLAAALFILSTIKPQNMASAIAGISVLFMQLSWIMQSMASLKVSKTTGVMAFSFMMNAMAVSILTLAIAMRVLGSLSITDTLKGLVAIKLLIGMMLNVATQLTSKEKAVLKGTGSLITFALALNILAVAVRKLGEMDLQTLAKGLGSMAITLFILFKFLDALNASKEQLAMSVKSAAALVVLGLALNVFAMAVKKFSDIPASSLVKGLGALGAVLYGLHLFMKHLGTNEELFSMAAGLLLLAVSINILTKSVSKLGTLTQDQLIQGLTALAAMLVMLNMTMSSLDSTMAGGGALVLVAIAIGMLTSSLILLGALPFEIIMRGLIGLASLMLVLGVSAMAVAGLTTPLLALAAVFAALGASIFLIGTGIAALSVGLGALAIAGTAGIAGLVAVFKSMIDLIPYTFKKLIDGIKIFITMLSEMVPEIINVWVAIGTALLQSVIQLLPQVLQLFKLLLSAAIEIFTEYIPKMAKAGIDILLAILTAIKDNIRQVVETAGMIIVNFLEGIATMLPAIIQAGFDVILAFINGLADAIENNTEPMIESVERLMDAIVTAAINWLKSSIEKFKKTGKKIMESGFIQGIKDKLEDLKKSAGKIYNYIKQAIDEKWEEFKSLGTLIIDGLIDGIKGAAGAVIRALKNVLTDMLSKAKEILGIQSPSKEAYKIGKFFDLGLAKGITSFATDVTNSAKSLGDKMLDTITESVRKVNDILDADMALNPTITPILDLSDIRKGMSGLNNIMDKAPTINVGSIRTPIATSSEQKDIQKGDASMTFVQNNYSPKALSRADIYRQTKNQFAAAKGLVTP